MGRIGYSTKGNLGQERRCEVTTMKVYNDGGLQQWDVRSAQEAQTWLTRLRTIQEKTWQLYSGAI